MAREHEAVQQRDEADEAKHIGASQLIPSVGTDYEDSRVSDAGIAELEQRIGVAPGFFDGLVQEDDWSFVIKLHALLEAACTHFLLFHFKGASSCGCPREAGAEQQDHRQGGLPGST